MTDITPASPMDMDWDTISNRRGLRLMKSRSIILLLSLFALLVACHHISVVPEPIAETAALTASQPTADSAVYLKDVPFVVGKL